MACLEHVCECGHVWFDNLGVSGRCEKCGSTNFSTFFDEDPSDFRQASEEDEEEDD